MCVKWLKKYRIYLFLAAWLAVYPLFLELAGIGCPFRFLFDVQCPGCGMTRAIKSVLRLDFASAFAFHPVWFVPPAAVALVVFFGVTKKEKAQSVVLAVAALTVLAAHVFRTFF